MTDMVTVLPPDAVTCSLTRRGSADNIAEDAPTLCVIDVAFENVASSASTSL